MRFLSFIQPSRSWKVVLFWSWWCRASLTVVSLEFYTRSASKSFPWAPKDVILLMSPDLFVLYGPGSWQYERIQGTGTSKQTLQHPLARNSRNLLSSEKQNIGMQMVSEVCGNEQDHCMWDRYKDFPSISQEMLLSTDKQKPFDFHELPVKEKCAY